MMRVGDVQWRAAIFGLALSGTALAAACDGKPDSGANSDDSSGATTRSSRRSNASSSSSNEDDDAGSGAKDAGKSSKKASGESMPISIQFVARVGTQDFACGDEYKKLGSSKTTIAPRDLRMFVQDVKLIDADGELVDVKLDVRKPWQTADVALLDFEDGSGECGEGTPELNSKITGHVPEGTYTGIRFTNGVPEELNHEDPAKQADPLKRSADLSWGWLTGFRFIKLDIVQVGSNAEGNALIHIGSTGCSGNAQAGSVMCSKPNRNQVELKDFDPESDRIVIDIAPIFAATDLTTAAECHSSGEACTSMFEAFGLDFKSGKTLKEQTVYSVE